MKNIDSVLWCETYRPTKLRQMVLSNEYKTKFKEYIAKGNCPHLLFYGPPGGGKTTLAFIIIKELKAVSLVLNASSKDRGINIVKGPIKDFASSSTVNKRLKIVFIDEADGMTPDAQRGLRNTIETYSKSCRFILTANNKRAILPAIQSRCTQFQFKSYKKKKVIQYVCDILDTEKIDYEIDDVKYIINTHYPDIRTIINNIELCSINGTLNPDETITTSFDYNELDSIIRSGSITKLRNMLKDVFDFTPIYEWLFDKFIMNSKAEIRGELAVTIGYYMSLDSQVLNKEIHFVCCCVEIQKLLKIKSRF